MPLILTAATKGRRDRRRPPFFRTKKLGILGATATLEHAPWSDPSWTLVAHPCIYHRCVREPDWWFDLHPRACFEAYKWWNPTYHKWLQTLRQPIFMQEDWPEIPMAVRFPKERVLQECRPYFTNHCAWMVALGMLEGVTHVGLWGCEYRYESDEVTERSKQRASLEYWLGRFEERGGHVVLPPGCNLMGDPVELYGYESHDEQGKLKASYTLKIKKRPVAAQAVPDAPRPDGPTHPELPEWYSRVFHKELHGRNHGGAGDVGAGQLLEKPVLAAAAGGAAGGNGAPVGGAA